MMAI
jgi:putative transposase